MFLTPFTTRCLSVRSETSNIMYRYLCTDVPTRFLNSVCAMLEPVLCEVCIYLFAQKLGIAYSWNLTA